MGRKQRILVGGLVALAVALAAGGWALERWLAGDGLRQRVQAEASAALGVPVSLQGLRLSLWPTPGVAVQGLAIAAQPPLSVAEITLRPALAPLLRGQLRLEALTARGAVLPQGALLQIAGAAERARPAPAPDGGSAPDWSALPRTVVLQDITWVAAGGARHTVDGRLRLDGDGWPAEARLDVGAGPYQGSRVALTRRAAGETAWSLRADIGGGTVQGPLTLTPPARADERHWGLNGELQTRGVAVAALTAPARPLSGRLEADTRLEARLDPRAGGAALTEALRSQTRFVVHDAVVHGVDLARAVRTVGLSRGGDTPLDTLAGQVRTRGRAVQLSQLVAASGALAATGEVAIAPSGALSGRVRVDLTGGAASQALGVPLVVGGTLDDPSVTLTRGALLGAAVGTALMPGVGTGAGASVGERLGEGLKGLFGGGGAGPDGERAAPRR